MGSKWRDQWARMGLTLDGVLNHEISPRQSQSQNRVVCALLLLSPFPPQQDLCLSAGSCVLVGKNLLGMMFSDKSKMEKNVYHMLRYLCFKNKKTECVCVQVRMCVCTKKFASQL